MKRVGAIDIGSNSIKYLVATSDVNGTIQFGPERTEETRISRGISESTPLLQEDSIAAALSTLKRFRSELDAIGVDSIHAVATSAVRDAQNGAEFALKVDAVLQTKLQILSGDEEARLIALGVSKDPNLANQADFRLFDLGGGSLEVALFKDGQLQDRGSLPLGAVRLTEALLHQSSDSVTAEQQQEVVRLVRTVIETSKASELLQHSSPLVGLGGAVAVARIMAASGIEKVPSLRECPAVISRATLTVLALKTCSLPLVERLGIPGLPAARADIAPVALLTLLTIMQCAKADSLIHSRFNLRYGLAVEKLTMGG